MAGMGRVAVSDAVVVLEPSGSEQGAVEAVAVGVVSFTLAEEVSIVASAI
jgi:hypothetical protein